VIGIDARPALLELDLASPAGAALLQAVTSRHGHAIADAANGLSRLFLLRSPWAPGLRFVGGVTKPPLGVPGADHSFSVGGAGETIEDAFAACVGEALERAAQFEQPGEVCARASLPDLRDQVVLCAAPIIKRQLEAAGLHPSTALDWVAGVGLQRHPNEDRKVLVPADWCFRRTSRPAAISPLSALSTGVAAGPSYEWAASRALLESVERDAAALWWMGGRRGRRLLLDDQASSRIAGLLASLRQNVSARRTWLLDITTECNIPVVAALSCSADQRNIACGVAARLSFEHAARAAILELCQMELALLVAAAKLAEVGDQGGLAESDRMHLERARELDTEACDLLHPLGTPGVRLEPVFCAQTTAIADILSKIGIEAALVPMMPPEPLIQVVRAVVPKLQPMPAGIITDRLQKIWTENGLTGPAMRYALM
jgi:ribosomal protein S12 methylthiotransferase accessory factor